MCRQVCICIFMVVFCGISWEFTFRNGFHESFVFRESSPSWSYFVRVWLFRESSPSWSYFVRVWLFRVSSPSSSYFVRAHRHQVISWEHTIMKNMFRPSQKYIFLRVNTIMKLKLHNRSISNSDCHPSRHNK
jgi:hypothetical protein